MRLFIGLALYHFSFKRIIGFEVWVVGTDRWAVRLDVSRRYLTFADDPAGRPYLCFLIGLREQ